MTSPTDVDLVQYIVIGDDQSGKELMMMKYAPFTGIRYNAEILNTVVEQIRGVLFVLIGTQIDKRLSMCVENYSSEETKDILMPRNQAELLPKRIGASKYLEFSEVTGGAFEIGHNYALERIQDLRRRISQVHEVETRKPSCIAQ